MVADGVHAQVVAVEREDYVAGELVQTDANGRPVMAVNVNRDDGNDVVIYAPAARMGAESSPPGG